MGTEIDKPYGWDLPALTDDQTQWLDDWFSRNGLSAAPATPTYCHSGCTYKKSCPFNALQSPLPYGRECPVERTLMTKWSEEMRASLGVEGDDRWSLMLIEYAGMWRVLIRRALIEASEEPVIIESFRGVDKEGTALHEKKTSPALSFVDRAFRTLQTIGKDLVATKEAKLKLDKDVKTLGPEEYARRVEAKIKDSMAALEEKERELQSRIAKKVLPVPQQVTPSEPEDDA